MGLLDQDYPLGARPGGLLDHDYPLAGVGPSTQPISQFDNTDPLNELANQQAQGNIAQLQQQMGRPLTPDQRAAIIREYAQMASRGQQPHVLPHENAGYDQTAFQQNAGFDKGVLHPSGANLYNAVAGVIPNSSANLTNFMAEMLDKLPESGGGPELQAAHELAGTLRKNAKDTRQWGKNALPNTGGLSGLVGSAGGTAGELSLMGPAAPFVFGAEGYGGRKMDVAEQRAKGVPISDAKSEWSAVGSAALNALLAEVGGRGGGAVVKKLMGTTSAETVGQVFKEFLLHQLGTLPVTAGVGAAQGAGENAISKGLGIDTGQTGWQAAGHGALMGSLLHAITTGIGAAKMSGMPAQQAAEIGRIRNIATSEDFISKLGKLGLSADEAKTVQSKYIESLQSGAVIPPEMLLDASRLAKQGGTERDAMVRTMYGRPQEQQAPPAQQKPVAGPQDGLNDFWRSQQGGPQQSPPELQPQPNVPVQQQAAAVQPAEQPQNRAQSQLAPEQQQQQPGYTPKTVIPNTRAEPPTNEDVARLMEHPQIKDLGVSLYAGRTDPKQDEVATSLAADGRRLVLYDGPYKGSFVNPQDPRVMFMHQSDRGDAAIRERVGHETYHFLEQAAPDVAAKIVDVFPPLVKRQIFNEYNRDYKAQTGQELAPERMNSEVGATILGLAATQRQAVWSRIIGKDRNLFQQFSDGVLRVLGTMTDKGRTLNSIEAQLQKFRKQNKMPTYAAGEMPATYGAVKTDENVTDPTQVPAYPEQQPQPKMPAAQPKPYQYVPREPVRRFPMDMRGARVADITPNVQDVGTGDIPPEQPHTPQQANDVFEFARTAQLAKGPRSPDQLARVEQELGEDQASKYRKELDSEAELWHIQHNPEYQQELARLTMAGDEDAKIRLMAGQLPLIRGDILRTTAIRGEGRVRGPERGYARDSKYTMIREGDEQYNEAVQASLEQLNRALSGGKNNALISWDPRRSALQQYLQLQYKHAMLRALGMEDRIATPEGASPEQAAEVERMNRDRQSLARPANAEAAEKAGAQTMKLDFGGSAEPVDIAIANEQPAESYGNIPKPGEKENSAFGPIGAKSARATQNRYGIRGIVDGKIELEPPGKPIELSGTRERPNLWISPASGKRYEVFQQGGDVYGRELVPEERSARSSIVYKRYPSGGSTTDKEGNVIPAMTEPMRPESQPGDDRQVYNLDRQSDLAFKRFPAMAANKVRQSAASGRNILIPAADAMEFFRRSGNAPPDEIKFMPPKRVKEEFEKISTRHKQMSDRWEQLVGDGAMKRSDATMLRMIFAASERPEVGMVNPKSHADRIGSETEFSTGEKGVVAGLGGLTPDAAGRSRRAMSIAPGGTAPVRVVLHEYAHGALLQAMRHPGRGYMSASDITRSIDQYNQLRGTGPVEDSEAYRWMRQMMPASSKAEVARSADDFHEFFADGFAHYALNKKAVPPGGPLYDVFQRLWRRLGSATRWMLRSEPSLPQNHPAREAFERVWEQAYQGKMDVSPETVDRGQLHRASTFLHTGKTDTEGDTIPPWDDGPGTYEPLQFAPKKISHDPTDPESLKHWIDYINVGVDAFDKGDKLVRPDLSSRSSSEEGRALYNSVDANRMDAGMPGVRKHSEVLTEAGRLVSTPEKRTQFINSVMAKPMWSDTENAGVELALKDMVVPAFAKAANGDLGDLMVARDLALRDRQQATETARGLSIRQDGNLPPSQRAAMWISRGLLDPLIAKPDALSAKNAQLYMGHLNKALTKYGLTLADLNRSDLDPARALGVYQEITASQSRTPLGMMREAYVSMGLLSGPRTHVVNNIGNFANIMLHYGVLRPLEGIAFDALRAVGIKNPGQARMGELPHIYAGMMQGMGPAIVNAIRTMALEVPVMDAKMGRLDAFEYGGGTYRQIPGAAGRGVRAPLDLLQAADQLAKTISGTAQASALAYREGKDMGLSGTALRTHIQSRVADLDSPVWQKAYDFATHLAFQDKLGPVGRALTTARDKSVVGQFLLPFIRTGTNIAKQASKLTPIGTLGMAKRGVQNMLGEGMGGVAGKPYPREEFARDAAANAIGWAATIGLLYLRSVKNSDAVTGPLPIGDKRDEKAAAMRGPVPGTIKIGGARWQYNDIEPTGSAMEANVTLADAAARALKGQPTKENVTRTWQELAGIAQDKTFLRALGDMMGMLADPEHAGSNLIADTAAGAVPNLYRSGRRASEGTYRSDYDEPLGRQITDRMMITRPEFPQVDPYGRDERTPTTGHGEVADFLNRWTNPVKMYTPSSDKIDRVDRMFQRYNMKNIADDTIPDRFVGTPQGKLDMIGADADRHLYDMTPEERYVFQKASGTLLRRALDNASLPYDNPTGPHVQAVKAIQQQVSGAIKQAMTAAVMAKQRGDTKTYDEVMGQIRKLAQP